MAVRSGLTFVFKAAAVTTAGYLGASALTTVALTAAAVGVGAFVFSYGLDTGKAVWQSAKTGVRADMFDKARAKKAAKALAFGVAGGAFGAWLHDYHVLKPVIGFVRDHAGHGVGGWFHSAMDHFHKAAPPVEVSSVGGRGRGLAGLFRARSLTHLFHHHAAPHVATATPPVETPVDDLSCKMPQNPVAAPAPVDLTPPLPAPNALQELASALKGMSHPSAAMEKAMQGLNLDDPSSIPAQKLKDLAHNALRIRGMDYEDRLKLARNLAQNAADRGNAQAVRFLKDIGAPSMRDPLLAPPAPVRDSGDAVIAAVRASLAQHPSAAPAFNPPAAVLTVTASADGVHYSAAAAIRKEIIGTGDYVVCHDTRDISAVSGVVHLRTNAPVSTREWLRGGEKTVQQMIKGRAQAAQVRQSPVVTLCLENMQAARAALLTPASVPALN